MHDVSAPYADTKWDFTVTRWWKFAATIAAVLLAWLLMFVVVPMLLALGVFTGWLPPPM